MKTIIDVCNSTKPKDIQKLQDNLVKNNCTQYFQAFKQEITYPTTIDYPVNKLVITNSFICDYNHDFFIYPIANIINIYKSNIINGEYNFTNMHVAVETRDNRRFYIGNSFRKLKDSPIDNFISNVKIKCMQYNQQQSNI